LVPKLTQILRRNIETLLIKNNTPHVAVIEKAIGFIIFPEKIFIRDFMAATIITQCATLTTKNTKKAQRTPRFFVNFVKPLCSLWF